MAILLADWGEYYPISEAASRALKRSAILQMKKEGTLRRRYRHSDRQLQISVAEANTLRVHSARMEIRIARRIGIKQKILDQAQYALFDTGLKAGQVNR